MDELEEALSQKDITQEQFDLAIDTSHELKNGILRDMNQLVLPPLFENQSASFFETGLYQLHGRLAVGKFL